MTLIPTLTDGVVRLRPPNDDDIEGSWEQCQDPLSQQWTQDPGPLHARRRAHLPPAHHPRRLGDRPRVGLRRRGRGRRPATARFAGTISLRNEGDRRAEIAYGSHPWARGRGVMERALRLLLDWGFAERDLKTVIWLARRGNWPSRRLAWRLGFSVEGTAARLAAQRGELADAWVGHPPRGEEQAPRHAVAGAAPDHRRVRSCSGRRADADLPRIVEALQRRDDPALRPADPRGGAARRGDRAGARARHPRGERAGRDARAGRWPTPRPTSCSAGSPFTTSTRAVRPRWATGRIPAARGRGAISQACRMLVRHAFIDTEDGGLGLRRLTANVAAVQRASHRVAGAGRLRADRAWSEEHPAPRRQLGRRRPLRPARRRPPTPTLMPRRQDRCDGWYGGGGRPRPAARGGRRPRGRRRPSSSRCSRSRRRPRRRRARRRGRWRR